MKTGDYTPHGLIDLYSKNADSSPVYVNKVTQRYSVVDSATVTAKRPKPNPILVKHGTERLLNFYHVANLQPGRVRAGSGFADFIATQALSPTTALSPALNLINPSELTQILHNKVREEIVTSSSQLGVDLLELRKTKAMFAGAAIDLLQGYRDIRRGLPLKTALAVLKKDGFSGVLGKRWLEFIYGWVPTISGAFDTADVLSKEIIAGTYVEGTVRARLSRNETIKYTNSGHNIVSYNSCLARGKAKFSYLVKDPTLLRMSALGLTNPLAMAWELLPWSFVLDWFVDVGGYVNRMDFNAGISDHIIQTSVKRNAACAVYVYGYQYNSAVPPAISTYERTYYHRMRPTSQIHNTFRGIKRFTNETVRLTSAVALINQQRNRIKIGR